MTRQHPDGWADTEKLLRRILELCQGAREAEAELHDTAHSSIGGNGSVSPGRSRSPNSSTHELGISDLTGEVATSARHSYMRRQLRIAASELPELRRRLSSVRESADKIEGILKRAVPSALDAEFREMLEHDEETARDYTRRHRRPA